MTPTRLSLSIRNNKNEISRRLTMIFIIKSRRDPNLGEKSPWGEDNEAMGCETGP